MTDETPDAAPSVWQMNDGELLDQVERALNRVVWTGILNRAATAETADVARRALSDRGDVAPLDGLVAAERLITSIGDSRWMLMRQAREDGATWDQVGVAAGLTGQDARAWYARTVTDHETHAPQWFDIARDRAVLADETSEADGDDLGAGC